MAKRKRLPKKGKPDPKKENNHVNIKDIDVNPAEVISGVEGELHVLDESAMDHLVENSAEAKKVEDEAVVKEEARRKNLIVNKFGSSPLRLIASSLNDHYDMFMTIHGMEMGSDVYLKTMEKLGDIITVSSTVVKNKQIVKDGEGLWRIRDRKIKTN